MTFTNFKSLVAMYMHRNVADFTVGSVDALAEAINDVKRAAQFEHDFESLRTWGFLSVSPYGTDISNFKSDAALTTALTVVRATRCWEYILDGTNTTPSRQIDFIHDTQLTTILPTSLDVEEADQALPVTGKKRVYQKGTKIYVTGVTTADTLMFEVIKLLPDLSAGSDTDIFITEYKPWTLLATIQALNFYLKEDQRIPISQAVVNAQWQRILTRESRLNLPDNLGLLD